MHALLQQGDDPGQANQQMPYQLLVLPKSGVAELAPNVDDSLQGRYLEAFMTLRGKATPLL